MSLEIGKEYVLLDGTLVKINDVVDSAIYKDAVVCEYKGIGPDHLYIKNWKDKDHKDYMKTTCTIDEKDDIIETNVGGTKHDKGKPMFSCLPPKGLLELGKVAELGARKYGLHNYRKGILVSRGLDAAFRHLIAAVSGEDKDPVDGNDHLASAAWNLLVSLQTIHDRPDLDDRFKHK